MNYLQIASILAAAMAVSFGAIGPALGRGSGRRRSDGRDRASAGSRRHHLKNALRRACDDRDDGDLLSGHRAPGPLRQPLHQLSPMHIDWWTLALQTVNVLILIWLLARFFFRPVREMVARRQEAAGRLLAEAEAERDKAKQLRADAEQAHAGLAEERERMIAAARTDAESERANLLKSASDEAAKLRTDAEQAVARDRAAMETRSDRRRSRSLHRRRGAAARSAYRPTPGSMSFSKDLCGQVAKMPEQMQSAFTADGSATEILTAAELPQERKEKVRQALEDGLRQAADACVPRRPRGDRRDRASEPARLRPQQLARGFRTDPQGAWPWRRAHPIASSTG